MIPLTSPSFDKNDEDALIKGLKSTFASGDGPSCRELERNLSSYLDVKHVFFVNSCTAALDLAYMVNDFPVGSEVLVPNFTFTSTALAPILNNLKVILVDVDPKNGIIDFDDAERKITSKTVAISPVDYAGNPVEIDRMRDFAKKYSLYVVHDAAQSFGAEFKGNKIGQFADVTTFSFHGTKNLVTGEGGAFVTNNDSLADKARIARDKGTDKYKFLNDPSKRGFYEYVSKGNSYVQSNLLAELGLSQLKKIDFMNNRRGEIANAYNKAFSNINGVCLPKITLHAKTNWHLYYLLVPKEIRNNVIESIRSKGIMANIHYRPLHRNEFYNQDNKIKDKDYPNSVDYFDKLLRIPMYPDLTKTQVEGICESVYSSLKEFI